MNGKLKHKNTFSALCNRIKTLSVFDLDWWQEVWMTITHNKSRSFLTAFGVFWGMLMLVLMVGSGVALQRGVMGPLEGFATNSCFFVSGSTSEPYKGFRKGRQWNIVNEDVPVLQQKIPEIEYLSPVLFLGKTDHNVVFGDRFGSYSVKGNYPVYDFIERSNLLYGRYINDIDILEKRKVCVIGERVYEELFGKGTDPVGRNIRVNGIYFQVIGVVQSVSQVRLMSAPEETVVLPFSTMQQAFNQGNRVHLLAATAQPGVKASVVEQRIKDELKLLHTISPTDEAAVFSINLEEQFTMFLYLGIGITSLIWIVGLGTLIAGGIGISNIMLVTVKERTKEIGIRRALGATPHNIIVQIMSESIILTIIAGLAGLMLGIVILQLLTVALSQGDQFFKDPQISFSVAVGSLFILLCIGTLAGYLPARRAMRIKPIEAIREE